MSTIRIGVALFVLAVVAGPLRSATGYSPVINLISELAAQNTQYNHIMSDAFVALGLGLLWDGARSLRWPRAAFCCPLPCWRCRRTAARSSD